MNEPPIAIRSGAAKEDMGACTRFVTIYGFVQKNIQNMSAASGGFVPKPHRDSAPAARWGTSVLQTPSFVLPLANSWLRPWLYVTGYF